MNIHEKIKRAKRDIENRMLKKYLGADTFDYNEDTGEININGCTLLLDRIDEYGNLFCIEPPLMPIDVLVKFAIFLNYLHHNDHRGPYQGRPTSHLLIDYYSAHSDDLDYHTVSAMIDIDFFHGEDQNFKSWLFGIGYETDAIYGHPELLSLKDRENTIVMPSTVSVYTTQSGSKIHLQPTCAGNAKKMNIHETDFLDRLENGEGCKNCIPQPDMIDLVKKDLKRKGY